MLIIGSFLRVVEGIFLHKRLILYLFPFSKLLFQDILGILPVGSPLTSSISSSITSSLAATPPSPAGTSSIPGMNANALPFYPTSDTVESVIGNFAIFTYISRASSDVSHQVRELGLAWVFQ